jgi:hypothetical protein
MSQARGKAIHKGDERNMWFTVAKLLDQPLTEAQNTKLTVAFNVSTISELRAKLAAYRKKAGFTDVVTQAERDERAIQKGRIAADTQAVERSIFADDLEDGHG